MKSNLDALSHKLVLPICLFGALVVAIVLAVVIRARGNAVEQAGLTTGQAVANQVITLRNFYTAEIVSRAKKSGMQLGFDFAQRDGVLPLPATLVKALGDELASKHPGSKLLLKSRYPFPNRGGEESKLDAFQVNALAALEKEPSKPVFSVESIDGRLSARYVVADVMKEGCVACHNSHPQSPKRDWKIGDVRGMVEVVVPVDDVAHSAANQAMMVCALVLGGFGAIGVALLVLVRRLVTIPLSTAAQQMREVANGNLNLHSLSGDSREMDALFKSLDVMVRRVRSTIETVRDSSASIHAASSEVASGNADLSQRTETAAANLQQTTSSMDDLTVTVGHSAGAAELANALANSAADIAGRGGEVVAQVVSTMDDISTRSKQIADIIGVIDGIAFQTNILALNAAVEAARAGERGRGFAVVASEVRSLAQRSATAAKEIKGLIDNSVDKVEEGARLVKNAGATMTEIVCSVRRVRDIIGEISAASEKQHGGINQINEAMGHLDHMTQQNAALVEQSANAAESLKQQAGRLAEAVSLYHF